MMEKTDTPSTNPSLLFLLRSLDNNERAWHTFVHRYRPLMVAWCRAHHLQAADIEEVVSRVLAILSTALRQFEYDPSLKFRGWLKRVVTHAVLNWLRERRRNPWQVGNGEDGHWQLEMLADPRSILDLAQQLDERITSDEQLLARAMAVVEQQVKSHTWMAFYETTVRGRAAAEVAHELNMAQAAIYMAKHRVIERIKAALARLGSHDDD